MFDEELYRSERAYDLRYRERIKERIKLEVSARDKFYEEIDNAMEAAIYYLEDNVFSYEEAQAFRKLYNVKLTLEEK